MEIMPGKTLTLQLRDAAKLIASADARQRLRDAADDVESAAHDFHSHSTYENITTLQCMWSRATRLLIAAEVDGDNGPSSGSVKEPAKLAA